MHSPGKGPPRCASSVPNRVYNESLTSEPRSKLAWTPWRCRFATISDFGVKNVRRRKGMLE